MVDGSGLINVTVKSREKTLFKGQVVSISSSNGKGVFDILPLHANFITLISQQVRLTMSDGSSRELAVSNAVLRASENSVEIFLGLSSL